MKKTLVILSLIIIAVLVTIEVVFWFTTSKSSNFEHRMNIQIANETNDDVVIKTYINGLNMSSTELEGITLGYFGQEFEYFDLNTPSDTFTFKIIEANGGIEQTTEINPADGDYLTVTFWGDKIVTEQTTEKQIRID